ncbi:hypothetical protein HN51_067149 [Arachis hypogaea]|uniref:Knottin scorpion toxin-like domain-containing protein n=1 Tax=Arachis hypogaea TaxID=3818 RepID=A0A444ZM54_ARAHY|nr:defensin-like protein 183 [Arachis hypogaea]QHO08575.1 uncharacterized protein DS421_14g473860 [Arachis hypogaea]RYR15244.1 hypothetical protein Ahy_B04g071970 [Arachis hypogaea]
MKAFANVLIVFLVFSIGIGNERLTKVTEAASNQCTQTLPSLRICVFGNECDDICKKRYGSLASGSCNNHLCVCQYPPPCHNL